MGRQLVAFVHVDGQVYGPGDDVPDEVAEKITNPKAWATEADEVDDAETEDEAEGTEESSDDSDESEAPAKRPTRRTASK